MEEIWKQSIVDKMEVSTLGNVRNKYTQKIYSQYIHNKYLCVGQKPRHKVHRLVCTAFNGNPDNDNLVVDHIDENRTNNVSSNLRWITRSENSKPRSKEIRDKCRLGAMITNNKRWNTPIIVDDKDPFLTLDEPF